VNCTVAFGVEDFAGCLEVKSFARSIVE